MLIIVTSMGGSMVLRKGAVRGGKSPHKKPKTTSWADGNRFKNISWVEGDVGSLNLVLHGPSADHSPSMVGTVVRKFCILNALDCRKLLCI